MNDSFEKLFDLTGKVALITGGSGIQGKRIARAFAAHGADVVVVDLDQIKVNELATSIMEKFI